METIKLPLCFEPARLKADLASIAPDAWTPHFNPREYQGDWRVVPLRSVGGKANHIYSDPTATLEDFVATPILSRCAYFQEVLAGFACPMSSVRLLSLGAGSRIREHRDYMLEYAAGDARLHIPIVTSPAVEFYLAGQRVFMNEGEAWYLDFSQPHSVYNGGTADRIHMVLDCIVNDWLRSLLERTPKADSS